VNRNLSNHEEKYAENLNLNENDFPEKSVELTEAEADVMKIPLMTWMKRLKKRFMILALKVS
jgi:hypothetical protein